MNQSKTIPYTLKNSLAAILLLAMISFLLSGAGCTGKEETELDWLGQVTAISQFADNANGTVTELSTGLMWKRCAQGQVYNAAATNCQGTGGGTVFGALSMIYCDSATVALSTTGCVTADLVTPIAVSGPAFDSCNKDTEAGFTDWRLPTSGELAAMAVVQDSSSLKYSFPDTPDDKSFWSATANPDDSGTKAYGVSFSSITFGDTTEFTKSGSNLYVRCVRNP